MLTIVRTRHWQRATARCMGTESTVMVDGDASHIRAAFVRLRELERCWSRFRPDSELNRWLATTDGGWQTVSDDLARALRTAISAHRLTGGVFDPTVRDSLEQLGYDRTFTTIDRPVAAPTAPAPGIAGLEVDGTHARIAPGVGIDLGGIGKGLAADIVADELVAAGAGGALVSLGGDMHAAGEPPADGWPVPIVDPGTDTTVATHVLTTGGLAMSTTALRRWHTADGRTVHHLIDPRDGASADSDLRAVAVAADSTAQAEAIAKAALILGSHGGPALVARLGVGAWFIAASCAEAT